MSNEYTVERLEEVLNKYDCTFYKLYINDKCLFDEFLEDIEKDIKAKEGVNSIYASMESYSPEVLLPKKKFNYVHVSKRSDVYEFKHTNPSIRVYVFKQGRKVYVILGSRKGGQTKAIERINSRFSDFPKKYEPIKRMEEKL